MSRNPRSRVSPRRQRGTRGCERGLRSVPGLQCAADLLGWGGLRLGFLWQVLLQAVTARAMGWDRGIASHLTPPCGAGPRGLEMGARGDGSTQSQDGCFPPWHVAARLLQPRAEPLLLALQFAESLC